MDERTAWTAADDDDKPEGEEEPRRHLEEKLLESRTILLAEPISAELSEDIVAKMLVMDAEDAKAPIDLYINSPGGSVDAGFSIYDMGRFISAPVRCICTGLTASAAVIVLMTADKKNRLSLPNSRFLIHQPSGGVRGSAADAKIEADEIIKIRNKINQMISEETGQPLERVEGDTRRNYWMNAGEALDYGLISSIVKSRAELK
jgi:ATP-dependent Clp protease protease subunit